MAYYYCWHPSSTIVNAKDGIGQFDPPSITKHTRSIDVVSDKHRATLAHTPMLLNLLITESAQEGRLRLSLSAYLCTSPEVIRRVPIAKSFSKVLTASPLAIHPRASITVITHTFEETELSSMMRRRSKRRARTLTEAIHYGRFEPSIGGGHRCDHIKKESAAILVHQ